LKSLFKLEQEEIERVLSKIDFEKMGGLLPVVAQEENTHQVLMQAFMNREALKLTLKTGKVHYWSRSRGRLWRKGETSGHEQILVNAILDCDHDALLLKVKQVGPCCHTGAKTCFHNPIKS
jgi:phosphoribosyl-AMP cyclohydrolase